MSGDESKTGAGGRVKQAIGGVRDRVASVQRVLALGFAAVVLTAMIRWALAVNVVLPLAQSNQWTLPTGALAGVIGAVIAQVPFILVLSGLAWLLAWIFEDRPLWLCLGAAVFAELWFVAIDYLSLGVEGLVRDPVQLSVRLALTVVAGFVAAAAYRHARRKVDEREDRRRRPPPSSVTAAPPAEESASEPAGEASPAADSGFGSPDSYELGPDARDEDVEEVESVDAPEVEESEEKPER